MKLRYPTWLKRLLLPFEFEDHPLHQEMMERNRLEEQQRKEDEELDELFRQFL